MKGKNFKKSSQTNEKTIPNQTLKQESHQNIYYLGYGLRNILGVIPEMDEGRTSPDGIKKNEN